MISKIKDLASKVLYVSKLTNVKSKKFKIFVSIFLANFGVALDILIIVNFAYLITGDITYTNEIINNIVSAISTSSFLFPLIVLLRFLSLFTERLNLELLSLDVGKNLRNYLMQEVYKLGNMSISDIYFYVNQVGSHVGSFYKSFSHFFNSALQIIGYSLFLIYTDFDTFLIFGLGAILIAFPSTYLLKKGKYFQHKVFNEGKNLNSTIQRIVENVFLIKILGTFKKEFTRLNESLENFRFNQRQNTIYGSINSIMPSFFTILTLSIIFVNFNISKVISLEFIAILTRLFQSIGNLNNGLGLVVNSGVNVEELYKLEKNKPQIYTNNYVVAPNIEKAVEIQGATFKYLNSDTPIFENINIDIHKHSHTVITGPNGSGKSTLLGMIAGLYLPETGKTKTYSKHIGYVGVTPLVFEGSLKENLLYGNYKVVDDLKIYDLLEEFQFFNDEKFELTKLISNKTLSSGQLQKISFIRSLLNDSDILLLDESTSNLDEKSKKFIFNILNSKNITIINSTHNYQDFSFDHHLKISVNDGVRRVETF
jgi:ATP-binding cassette subfamily B protein